MSSNVKKCSVCGRASIEHCLQCKCWAAGSHLDSEKKIRKREIKMSAEDEPKGEVSKFGDKVKITYGPEKREADDVTLNYLQKMSDDELLVFCCENDIRIPEEYHNRGYLISIIKKHCLV